MNLRGRIYIAGHQGIVGSALLRELIKVGYKNLIIIDKKELDLRDFKSVECFFKFFKPEFVLIAAAKVGGIKANMTYPADFLYDNLLIQTNVFQNSYKYKVKKILFLGSSCIYPKNCPQPMKEEYLMTGTLEPTNEAYAIAKITGLKMAKYYYEQYGIKSVCAMPCNLYGFNDSFDPDNSHVISSLVKKFSDAVEKNLNEVVVWGTGIARREFMNVDDASKALILLMNIYDSIDIINVGCGYDISIKDLVGIIKIKTGFKGKVVWDSKMPDGMLKKCMDIIKLKKLGFVPSISLEEGIEMMVNYYKEYKK